MRTVKVGMASLNTTIGAFENNVEKIKKAAQEMHENGCNIGCFQECVISGYPSEDLVLWEDYVSKQNKYLHEILSYTKNFSPYYILGLAYCHNGLVYNAAALIGEGKIIGIVPKEELPNYDVFYDGRQFTAGLPNYFDETAPVFGDMIFDFPWGKMGIAICEDMWTSRGPIPRRAFSGAELIVNISASPWRHGVTSVRENIVKARSEDNQIALVYVNQFGGNDSLVFDGGCIVAQNGNILYKTPRWEEKVDFYTIDLNQVSRNRKQNTTWRNDQNDFVLNNKICHVEKINPILEPIASETINIKENYTSSYFMPNKIKEEFDPVDDAVNAVITGLNDYYEKIGVFKGIAIGCSGGRDSMLTTLFAAEWAYRTNRDPKIIKCYSMPSKYNSEITKSLASDIANELGVSFIEIPIQETFDREVGVIQKMSGNNNLQKLTLQNMQARVRGMRMWNISNELGLLWLQSGNMSEKAVGYTTIGGDIMGGFSLLGNIPKTVVNKLLIEAIYSKSFIITQQDVNYPSKIRLLLSTLTGTKASAELSEDQEDERDLMPFDILDLCYWLFVQEKKTPQEIYDYLDAKFTKEDLLAIAPNYKQGMLKNWVTRFIQLFFRSIFKWVQSPQAIHMGPIDLDRERALQLPVVTSLEWLALEKIKGDR